MRLGLNIVESSNQDQENLIQKYTEKHNKLANKIHKDFPVMIK